MLELRAIRHDPDAVKAALARKAPDLAPRVDELLAADETWRAATAAAESLRAEQKQASEAIGAAKARGEDAADALARVKELSATVKERTEEARTAEERLQAILVTLPNLPDPTATDEDTTIREVGEAGREGRDHLELAGDGSIWSAARGCRARASPTCAATSRCSRWRSCAGRPTS